LASLPPPTLLRDLPLVLLAVIPRVLLVTIPLHVSYRIPTGFLQCIPQVDGVTLPRIIGLGASPTVLEYLIRQAPLRFLLRNSPYLPMYAMLVFPLRVILGLFLAGSAALNIQLGSNANVVGHFPVGATRKPPTA